MSFTSEFNALQKKRKKTGHSFTDEFLELQDEEIATAVGNSDIAPVVSSGATRQGSGGRGGSDKDTWFQSGAFEDGFQATDLITAPLATVADVGIGVLDAGLGVLEGISDLILHGAGYVADAFEPDHYVRGVADDLHDAANRDTIGQLFDPLEGAVSKHSLLGEKVETVEEVVGAYGGQLGMAVATGGWSLLATGLSAAGSGMTEAYLSGATDEEAANYGIASGAIAAGTEALTGGLGKFVKALGFSKGIGGLDDMFAKKLTDKITNITVKNAAQWGIKATGEGLEEVLEGLGSAVAKKMTYMSEEDLGQLVKDENLLDSFLIGIFMSGASQSGVIPGTRKGSLIEANKTGRDFVTGLNTNEQSVVDKVYEDAITEAEKDGKTLSKKDKTKLYDKVLEDMDKGRISIDTIEEVLGGEEYKTYKDTITEEDAILKEFEELGNKENPTLKDSQRYAVLEERVNNITNNSIRNDLKAKLDTKMSGLMQNSRLAESYRDRARRGQKFEADVSQYKGENAKKTVQNAIDSGFMNNGVDAHDFVDFAAKLAEARGYEVVFADSKGIKAMKAEYDLKADPNRIEGFNSGKTKKIIVNMDANKSWASIVGHEFTDTIREAGHFEALRDAAKAYAEAKGEYQAKLDSVKSRYAGIEADIDGEVTSDIVGEYLNNDYDFVKHLHTNNRNVFQKIYDEIKYLYKLATAGSKEARQLEKMKHNFEKAIRESNGAESKGETKYSLGYHAGDLGKAEFLFQQGRYRGTGHFGTGTYFVGNEEKISGDNTYGKRPHHAVEFDDYNLYKIKNDEDGYNLHEQLAEIDGGFSKEWLDAAINDMFSISNISREAWELSDKYDVRHYDAELGFEVSDNYREAVYKAYTETASKYSVEHKSYEEWLSSEGYDLSEMDDFDKQYSKTEYADYLRDLFKEIDQTENDGFGRFSRAVSRLRSRFGYKNTENALREVLKYQEQTKNDRFNFNKRDDSFATVFMKALGYEGIDTRGTRLDNVEYGSVIYDLKDNTVKYSLSDSDGKQLTKEQSEYFKGSKVRDENGNLKVMYHGTPNGDFTVFKDGTYFTENKWYADLYQNPNASSISTGKVATNPKTFEVYLDIKKPFDISDAEARAIYINDYIKGGNAVGINPYLSDAEYSKIDTIDWTEGEDLREFLIDNGYDYDGLVLDEGATGGYGDDVKYRGKSYVVFNPEQIKSADNPNPTSNPDINYSLSDTQGKNDANFNQRIDKYNQKQYNDFGWARDIDAISKNELDDMYSKIHVKGSLKRFPKSSSGEAIIEVNDSPHTTLGANNVFAFVKGTKNAPEITRVVRVNFFDEASVDVFRKDIYANTDHRSLEAYARVMGEEFVRYYDRSNSANYGEYANRTRSQQSGSKSEGIAPVNRNGDQRNGAFEETQSNGIAPIKASSTDGVFFDGENDVSYSLSDPNTDKTYADAVNRGDMNTAQRMVDEAAKQSGYSIRAYHGTPNTDFTVFDKERLGKGNDQYGAGFYFTTDKTGASHYGNRVIDAALSIKNPIRFTSTAESGRNLIDAEITLTSKQAYEVVKRLPNIYDAEESPLGDYFDAYWEVGAKDWMIRELAEQYRDVGYLDSDLFRDYPNELHEALRDVVGYDGVEVTFERTGEKFYVAWFDNQMKSTDPVTYDDNGNTIPLSERFNADKNDIRNSLSAEPIDPTREGNPNESMRYHAPVREDLTGATETATATENTTAKQNAVRGDFEGVTEDEANALARDNLASLTDEDMPPEVEAPYYESENAAPSDPFANRDIKEVGNRKVKAYMYENPEVKPFFQEEAEIMLGELQDTTKGEKWYNDDLYYATNGEEGWGGTQRQTSDAIAYLLDNCNYTYAQIEQGLQDIIKDNGKENNAVSKRIEFLLNERLSEGYTDFRTGMNIPANDGYLNLLNEKQITEYSKEAFDKLVNDPYADAYAPSAEDYAPATEDIAPVVESAPKERYEAIRPKRETQPRMKRVDSKESQTESKVAEVYDTEPEVAKKKSRGWSRFKTNFLDKGSVFEDLSLKTKNRELMGKWNHTLSSESRAQWMIGNGANGVKSLNAIREEVEGTGHTKEFYEYLYHKHNADRMNLEERYKDIKNKPVFGYDVTAEMSQDAANKLEKANPEFKAYADDVYAYMNHLRSLMVDSGVISQETADLWAEMYPHYVPIRRLGDSGLNINVPLDTGRTGVNAPIKRATGGNRDILPLFDTMALRTEQTFKAIAKNNFGVELKNTLGTTIERNATSLDEVIEGVEKHEDLLKKGENGRKPTFTVFEDGKKVTFEITEDMYDAMKPKSEGLAYTNKIANKISNFHRGLLTEFNPAFMATNAIKDVQDVLINSQHPAKTYANIPLAIGELVSKGKWYTEYMQNGGEQNTYFDGETNSFTKDKSGISKLIGMPLDAISKANNFIERMPRLAEYIASRKNGASVEVAMLDAARVTTNFAAGGDVTKFLNRNGATFLNASVQGAMQQVRNVREAKANGLKGWVQLATKFAVGGLSVALLNHLMWEDDEEYEELSDYVKQNYYVVAKTEDGQFVRIPKGRALAVIQNAFEQTINAATGDDEVDLKSFLELAISNLAPNNPVEDNILAPIIQVANNETWYGEDLVPTRLQDLPAAEQYDESTDAISKWLGEKLNISPYKVNYLLNQYSGGVGDVFLPMMTPEAERGDNSFLGNMLAPVKDKFTTDSVMNNQNVSDFYDTVDTLTTNAKSSKATDEDVLKYKYMNSVNTELGELYAQKREIQNSDLSDAEKYEAVREIQEQINSLARESLATYGSVNIDNGYATVGDRHYKLNKEGEWEKVSDKQLEKQNEVTRGLGISASEYWSNKEEYDYAYDYPEKYAVAKAVGGYSSYKTYQSELYDIKADKDEDGKSINGSRKEKVIDYVNSLDIDYGERLILFKSEYNADDTYNYDIIEYLNGREDISYSQMETILKELGFKVDSKGNITWD